MNLMNENEEIDPQDRPLQPILQLLAAAEIGVINLGLSRFADTLARQNVPFIHVDWRPPADGDPGLADILAALKR